jgi:hypothetical protein
MYRLIKILLAIRMNLQQSHGGSSGDPLKMNRFSI